MLYATEIMGAAAYASASTYVGRVREFFIEPADQPNRISHFLISRGRFQPIVARYDQVSKVLPGRLYLNVSERALAAYQPNEAWLAVQKDLLDQQIIDTAGRSQRGTARTRNRVSVAVTPFMTTIESPAEARPRPKKAR